MPYQVDRYNGTPLTVVDDGTISNDRSTLKLVGKNYAGYGEIQNENFIWLMENFANSNPPANYLSGQIWFDSFNRKLKFNDGSRWRTTGGAEIGPEPPVGLTTGDFWWNTTTKQLFSYDGTSEFVLIGPQVVPGAGETLWESTSLIDTDGNPHAVMKGIIDGKVIYICSRDTFFIDSDINPVTGFSYIRGGLTLVDTTDSTAGGFTTSTYRHWGTSSDSDRLGQKPASDYVTKSGAVFVDSASFADDGFTVGAIANLRIYALSGTTPTIENRLSGIISFKVKTGSPLESKEICKVKDGAFDPGLDVTYDLGEPTLRWRNVYAQRFIGGSFSGTFEGDMDGTALRAKRLYFANAFGTTANENDPLKYVPATNLNQNNTIVARDNSGNFSAGIMTGTATQARYADLAERYESDSMYDPGTVVIFGGDKEITVTTELADYRVAGVVSTNPAYEMNVSPETKDFLPVALRGKVPVKVVGRVKKGDILVTSGVAGYAVSVEDAHQVSAAAIIAKALEEKFTDDPGVVMAVIV